MLVAIAVLLFSSCEDKTKSIDDSYYGYQYFPLEVGNYWIYQVDSLIVRNFGATLDSKRSFVKEELTDVFINADGDTAYRLERSTSEKREGPYLITDVWTAERDTEGAYRTEENLRFNKLSFPIQLGNDWTGNLFDNLTEVSVAGETVWVYKDWGRYRVASRGISRGVAGQTFTNVVKIDQADHDFGIERRYSVEYYAPGVGLIEKEMEIYDTQCACPGQSWQEKAEAGFYLRQLLLEFN